MRGFVDVRLCVFEHQIDGRHTKETFPLTFDPGLCAANQTLCMVCFAFFLLFLLFFTCMCRVGVVVVRGRVEPDLIVSLSIGSLHPSPPLSSPLSGLFFRFAPLKTEEDLSLSLSLALFCVCVCAGKHRLQEHVFCFVCFLTK